MNARLTGFVGVMSLYEQSFTADRIFLHRRWWAAAIPGGRNLAVGSVDDWKAGAAANPT
jgi:hypothetical protein